ncbi:MAG: hypothetical protein WCG44_02660 [bacterium]
MSIETKIEYLRPNLLENDRDLAAFTNFYSILGRALAKIGIFDKTDTTDFTSAGSDSEELYRNDYWKVKHSFDEVKPENNLLARATQYAREVAVDNHIYLEKPRITIEKLYDIFLDEFMATGETKSTLDNNPLTLKSFSVADIDGYSYELKYDQISKSNKKRILRGIVYKNDDSKQIDCGHLEFTNSPKLKKQKRKDRRQFVGGITDIRKKRVIPDKNGFIVTENRRLSLLKSNAEITKLNTNKDNATLLENTTRNVRKIISEIVSDQIDISNFSNRNIKYTDKNTNRKNRYFNSSKNRKHFLKDLASFQIETYYREMLVSAGWDAERTIKALTSSGLDKLFFGRRIGNITFNPDSSKSQLMQFLSYLEVNNINLNHLSESWQHFHSRSD